MLLFAYLPHFNANTVCPIMVLLDGLYPTGPTMELCATYGWQFMIVLQDGSLPHVWEEYRGLVQLLEPEDRYQMDWGGRELFLQLKGHEGLPLPDAHRPPTERAGTAFTAAGEARAGTGSQGTD